jgi:hypothetical protein
MTVLPTWNDFIRNDDVDDCSDVDVDDVGDVRA